MRNIIGLIITVVSVLLLAFAALSSLGNLIGMPQIAASLGTTVPVTGWFLLIVPVASPLLLAVAAWFFSKRRLQLRPLFFLLALTVAAVVHIELLYLIPRGAYLEAI